MFRELEFRLVAFADACARRGEDERAGLAGLLRVPEAKRGAVAAMLRLPERERNALRIAFALSEAECNALADLLRPVHASATERSSMVVAEVLRDPRQNNRLGVRLAKLRLSDPMHEDAEGRVRQCTQPPQLAAAPRARPPSARADRALRASLRPPPPRRRLAYRRAGARARRGSTRVAWAVEAADLCGSPTRDSRWHPLPLLRIPRFRSVKE
jgi:hypothetical protein